MAQGVVELLEVVDVDQPHGQRRVVTLTLPARTFGGEGLHQAAPVGHLRQGVGAGLVGQDAQFAFQRPHLLFQGPGTGVLAGHALLGLANQVLHGTAVVDQFAHHTGQAFDRFGRLDGLHVPAHAVVETASVLTQFADLVEQAVDQLLERVARLLSLAAHAGMVLAGLGQDLRGRPHAAAVQSIGQPRMHRLRLAAGPAVVLGQFGQALAQFGTQASELLDQLVAVREQAADLAAGAVQFEQTFDVGAFGSQPVSQGCKPVGQFDGAQVAFGQAGVDRQAQRRQHGRPAASHVGPTRFGCGGGCRRIACSVNGGGLTVLRWQWRVGFPRADQRAQPLLQALHVAAAAIQHPLQTVLLARGGPLLASPLQHPQQPLEHHRPGLRLRARRLCTAVQPLRHQVPSGLHEGPDQFLATGRFVGHPGHQPVQQHAGALGQYAGRLSGLFRIGAGVVLGGRFLLRSGQAAQCALGNLRRGGGSAHGSGIRARSLRSSQAWPLTGRGRSLSAVSAWPIQLALRPRTDCSSQSSRSVADTGRLNR